MDIIHTWSILGQSPRVHGTVLLTARYECSVYLGMKCTSSFTIDSSGITGRQPMGLEFALAEVLPRTIKYVTLRHDIWQDKGFHCALLVELLGAGDHEVPKLAFFRFGIEA